MSRVNSRRARRMMKQMGLKMDELGDIERVILQGPRREIVIEGAAVTSINVQGQKMYQIAGGNVTEQTCSSSPSRLGSAWRGRGPHWRTPRGIWLGPS
jgi:NACalpha-BTF3-like transcription factor